MGVGHEGGGLAGRDRSGAHDRLSHVRSVTTAVSLHPLVDALGHRQGELGVLVLHAVEQRDRIVDAVELHRRNGSGGMDGRYLDLPGNRGDRGKAIGGLGRQGIGHHPSVGYAGRIDAAQVDGCARGDVRDDLQEEADVIDLLRDRQAAALPRVPAVLRLFRHGIGREHSRDPRAVGVRNEIPVLVGGVVHARLQLLQHPVLRCAGQVEHERKWLAIGGCRRNVQQVVPGSVAVGDGKAVGEALRSKHGMLRR